MSRFVIFVLVLAGVVWADDEPDWDAAPIHNADDPNRDDILNKDIDDFLSQERFHDESGWKYDHFEIWERVEVDVSIGLWYPELKGPITLGNLTKVDLSTGLGLDQPEVSGMWGIVLRQGMWELIFDGFTVRLSGTRVIDEQFELPTTPPTIIAINDTLTTKLAVSNYRLLAGIRVYRSKAFTVTLQFGMSFYYFKFRFSAVGKERVSFNQILPLPVIGLALSGRFGPEDRWEYRAEVQGLAIKLSQEEKAFGGRVVDSRVTFGYRIYKALAIRVGYRYANIGAFVEGLQANFDLQGPFLEVVGEF